MSGIGEPQTDREWIMSLDAKIDRLADVIEALGTKWETFEEKKLNEIERRLSDIERWQAKWGGALIALSIISLAVGIVSALIKMQ